MKKIELVFATHNINKAKEIENLLPDFVEVKTLKDIGCNEDIPETQSTLEGNALQKARYVYENYGVNCFADDTGLEIDALGGEPGVRSARYAGDSRDDEENMLLVLTNLKEKANRSAQFRTVIALVQGGEEHIFEGVVRGEIKSEKRGNEGFGYDPIFEPESKGKTFAEMSLVEKNECSHRSRAIAKLSLFLEGK